MNKPVYLILFLFIVIIALSLVQVGLSNQISTAGADLTKLETSLVAYQKENIILQEQYLDASSFTNLAKKAKKLGFVEAKSQIYLNTPLPLALKQ